MPTPLDSSPASAHTNEMVIELADRQADRLVPPPAPLPGPVQQPRPAHADSRIPSLDGLRAISIAMVFLIHLGGTRNFPLPHLMNVVGDLGNFGVRVFFVISGYLITRLLLGELERSGTISLRGFYARRFFRIFPAFYVYLGLMVVLQALGKIRLLPDDLLCAMTYTVNYHHTRSWYIGHIWSLSVEEQFYLLWPALLLILGRRRGLTFAALAILLAPLWRTFVFLVMPDRRVAIGESFPTIADAIAAGCVLAGLRGWLATQPAYLRFLRSPAFYLVPILAVAANLLSQHPRADYLVGQTMMNVCIAICIDRFVRLPDGPVGGLLNARPMVFIGTLSYSLYLYQQPFLDRHSDATIAAFPLNLLCAFAAALLSYYLVEKPVLRLRHSFSRR